MSKSMLAISVLLLVAEGISSAQDSDPSCLLQHRESRDRVSVRADFEEVCPEEQGEMCQCRKQPTPPVGGPVLAPPANLAACCTLCEGKHGFNFRESDTGVQECWCCDDENLDTVPLDVEGDWKEYMVYIINDPDDNSTVEGDPHIKTLDGRHYTLLQQGTFSLWHFSGVDASQGSNKGPVDWHIYAHYSGSQSFTKGLLLVDKTGGSVKQTLELTSQDCEWRARSSMDDWTLVSDGPISVPSAATEILVSKKSGAKGHNHVRLNLNTQKGKTEIAVLSLSCRPHHSINLQLVMKNRADNRFVDGELQMGRRDFSKLGMLQISTSADSAFAVHDSWQSLGGSEQAALYLEMDTQAEPIALLSTPCTSEAEDAAKQLCSKHLGDDSNDKDQGDQSLFEDCVYDLCHGADETVAELAGELRDSTRAI